MYLNVRSIISTVCTWYGRKDRWWLPLLCGLFFSIGHPPFNHETHPLLFPFPFLVFVTTIPLFIFSLERKIKRAVLKTYLFGITASLTQFYWIANVMVEDVWLLIMLGLFLLTMFIATFFLLYGMLFRLSVKFCGRLYIIVYPAAWILIEYIRTLGDLSFPWEFPGNALSPLLPLVQIASVTGIYGLSFLVVLGNILIWELLQAFYRRNPIQSPVRNLCLFVGFLILITVGGFFRLNKYRHFDDHVRISLIQNNMDQAHWENGISLDTSMTITEEMVFKAVRENPEMLVFPESAIFCYLERNRRRWMQVLRWSEYVNVPFLLGTLHFERERETPYYKYRVYNAVFFLDTGSTAFEHYYKIKLVPFSEALPFEGAFPILSRINLGESDFSRGKKEIVFNIHDRIYPAPFICYEIIYPDFVRRRVKAGANMLVNVTNDGWFGHSTAAFQHAAMARMRSIENGVSLARCANSGISMLVDPVGRIIAKTKLYSRTVLTDAVTYEKIPTVYTQAGDWIIGVSLLVILAAGGFSVLQQFRRRERT